MAKRTRASKKAPIDFQSMSFGPLLTRDQIESFREKRWSQIVPNLFACLYIGTYDRAGLVEVVRGLDASDEGALDAEERLGDVIDFLEDQKTILESIRARFMVAVDQYLIEEGEAPLLPTLPRS